MTNPEARAAYYEQCWEIAAEAGNQARKENEKLRETINALKRERDEARETVARLQEWHALTAAGLRLRLGELTSQEIRTVRAVLNAVLTHE